MRGAVILAFLTAGCATVHTAPAVTTLTIPATWTADSARAFARADTAALGHWWTTLGDPMLTNLVERGIKVNPDLRQAESRVLEARARRGVAAAGQYPAVTAGGSSSSSNTTGSAGSGSAQSSRSSTLFSLGSDASWEVDLFGRQRYGVQAAKASLQASVEDQHDVMVTLTSDVARYYIAVRVAQSRLATALASLRAQSETYDIVQLRYQAGLVTQLDVEQARYNLEQTRASIPTLRTTLSQGLNQLAVLLGEPPGALNAELADECPIPAVPVSVAVGIPADVLRRRPDVRRAERQLAAQSAQVGAAAANRFPSLSLVGSIGLDALSPGKLLSDAARSLVGTATGNHTLFDAGRINQNVAIERSVEQQLALAYQATVTAALQDVDNALVAFGEEQARHEALVAAAGAASRAASLAETQYRAGLIDFQAVLDAQRSALSLQDQLDSSAGAVASDLVSIYRAVGGGWTPDGAPRVK